jgi:hypothetical protein
MEKNLFTIGFNQNNSSFWEKRMVFMWIETNASEVFAANIDDSELKNDNLDLRYDENDSVQYLNDSEADNVIDSIWKDFTTLIYEKAWKNESLQIIATDFWRKSDEIIKGVKEDVKDGWDISNEP